MTDALVSCAILLGFAFLAAAGAGIFPWALALCAGLLAVLLLGLHLRRRASGEEIVRAPHIEWAALALLAFLTVTALPLPDAALSVAGSATREANQVARQLLETGEDVGAIPDTVRLFSLSRNRGGTLRLALLASAQILITLLVLQLGSSARRRLIFATLAGIALISVAGVASLWRVPQGDTLWWHIAIPHGLPGPAACFVNRNHFGGYAAMGSGIGLGLCVHALWARRGLSVLGSGALYLICTAGAVLSLSRGAWLALIVAHAAMGIALLLRGRIRYLVLVLLAGAGLMAAVWHAPLPRLQERLDTLRAPLSDLSAVTRVRTWTDALQLVRDYPIFGTGANGFRHTFSQVRSDSDGAWMTHAENQYVQVLTAGGVLGTALFVVFCVAVFRARGPAEPSAATPSSACRWVAIVAGSAVAANALVDFPLHVPLYTLTATLLVAAALRPSNAHGALASRWVQMTRGVPVLELLLLDVILVIALFTGPMSRFDQPHQLHRMEMSQLAAVTTWSPTDARAWYYLGKQALRTQNAAQVEWGVDCLQQAGRCDPNNYRLWRAIAGRLAAAGAKPEALEAYRQMRALRSWVPVPAPYREAL